MEKSWFVAGDGTNTKIQGKMNLETVHPREGPYGLWSFLHIDLLWIIHFTKHQSYFPT